MRHRSFGVTALAFGSIMVALYCQVAAIALLLTGSVFNTASSMDGTVALVTGAIFLGLTAAAYLVGFGFWTGKHWSWAGGLVVFAALICANVLLLIVSGTFVSVLLPSIGAVVAMVYMQRPSVRAELLGTQPTADASVTAPDQMDAVEPAH